MDTSEANTVFVLAFYLTFDPEPEGPLHELKKKKKKAVEKKMTRGKKEGTGMRQNNFIDFTPLIRFKN